LNDERERLIEQFRAGFGDVEQALSGITNDELDRRPPEADGWTARQVAHHLADSEAMAYTRLRRLVADDEPLIQGYDAPVWARRLHYDGRPIEASLAVVRAVRESSLQLLAALTPDEWSRTGTHSESGGGYTVDRWLEIYANHCHDHAEQIRAARGAGAVATAG
jgi:DinB family protein